MWDTAFLTAEVAYSRLDKVTLHPELFKGEGYAGCPTGQDKTNGCATNSFLGVALNFNPSWYGVFPSVDMALPFSLNYGIRGNGATLSGGNEKAYTASLGLVLTFSQAHELTLRYADSHAGYKHSVGSNGLDAVTTGNGNYGTNDRGWLSLTFKTQF